MESIAEKMMLGSVNLKDYINAVSQDERKSWQYALNKLKKDNLPAEKVFVEELEKKLRNSSEYQEYPMMELSFLKATIKIDNPVTDKSKIVVPKFGVFRYFGDNKMEVRYYINTFADKRIIRFDVLSRMPDYNGDSDIIDNVLDNAIVSGIVNSKELINFKGLCNRLELDDSRKSREIIETYFGNQNPGEWETISAVCYFNGLIPDETKEKVKRAKEVFKTPSIYIIWETKPENWKVEKYVVCDPLVVGVKGSKAYFIDHFNCTPLETAIVNNYVGGRLN